MKQIIYYLRWYLLTALLLPVGLFAQMEMTLGALQEILQSDLYYPASAHQEGWHVGFPSVFFQFSHTGPAYRDLIRSSEDGPRLQTAALVDQIDDSNELIFNYRLQTLKVKFVRANWGVGFEHEIVSSSHLQYPKTLPELYVNGNQPWIGQRIEIGPNLRTESYNSYGFLVSHQRRKWSVGARAKLLTGVQLAYNQSNSVILYTDPLDYRIQLQTDYRFSSVGVINFEEGNLLNYQLGDFDRWKWMTPNLGLALDAGIQWRPKPSVDLSFAISDMGAIRWKSDLSTYEATGTRSYDGLVRTGVLDASSLAVTGLLDTLRQLFAVQEESGALNLALPWQAQILINYRPADKVRLSWQSRLRNQYDHPWAHALVITALPSDRWTASGAISSSFGAINLGFAASGRWGPVQVFTALDNVLSGIDPWGSNRFNLRAGVNVHLASTLLD